MYIYTFRGMFIYALVCNLIQFLIMNVLVFVKNWIAFSHVHFDISFTE